MSLGLEEQLCEQLLGLPYKYNNRYTDEARLGLLEVLFRSLTNDRSDYLSALFPNGFSPPFLLKKAQGTGEQAEYSEAARGHACGHIFKQGEASYHCMTCTDDATCVLCSRCFDASDHEGHLLHISPSAGNSGCCDCGDLEAWRKPVNCAIHTASEKSCTEDGTSPLPPDLIKSIQITIGRVLDYFCDVISCSPEQLRLPKTEENILQAEKASRLPPGWYGTTGDEERVRPEYCLIVWNDEKHTIIEVTDVIKRACRQTAKFAEGKAWEANDMGRSILRHSQDIKELIRMSNIVESIKATTTIRSSRDTFREQMCGTIIEWLTDISGCSIGGDSRIIRYTVCEEMLQQWRIGSEAVNARIGRSGIDDHAFEETTYRFRISSIVEAPIAPDAIDLDDDDDDVDVDDWDGQNVDPDEDQMDTDMDIENTVVDAGDLALFAVEPDLPLTDTADNRIPTAAPGIFAWEFDRMDVVPQPEEAATAQRETSPSGTDQESQAHTPTASEPGDFNLLPDDYSRNYNVIPETPTDKRELPRGGRQGHWAIQPSQSREKANLPRHEDLTKNIRLDSMILFDMRIWKKTRINLRDLLIGTVINIPAFKRILGLRFSGLYTSLSQLYLIADREPEHSIINLSLQMLTSPSITKEVIERGNFLTNLMAILYTFLTSRQVGFPRDVSTSATLAYDIGSVTNRRLHHFFTDLRFFLSSEPVQRKVREEKQYLLQFLDLVKLSQGICPNVRAIGEHLEYETDAWIGASLLTREINKLCRQFSESFSVAKSTGESNDNLKYVLYTSALATIINSVGLERKRSDLTEIKLVQKFKVLRPFAFESNAAPYQDSTHRVIDFKVETGSLSFHHALHYTLSWLIEAGKSLSNPEMRSILSKAGADFIKQYGVKSLTQDFHEPEDALLALYDYPLRVCAWLAQMKAGMWVRNGMSLRHQMLQYKGVNFRDVGYHRDIFLLQTAFVTCDPNRFLATMIDRYGLDNWLRGAYDVAVTAENQLLDITEDFLYLLIMILTDRSSLIAIEDEPEPLLSAARRDIIHALCFKPLSFSDLNTKLNEKIQDYQNLQSVLEEMTIFHPPEGMTDTGTFELKPQYLEQIDPYSTSYSKNQRDEAENIYKKWMSRKTGNPPEEIVLEPKLRPIPSGAFSTLSVFTSLPLFAQVIYYTLSYTLAPPKYPSDVTNTRRESLLQVILQLALIASLEDVTAEDDFTEDSMKSFIHQALKSGVMTFPGAPSTIVEALQRISNIDAYASCKPKIKYILKLCCKKRPRDFDQATVHLEFPFGRLDTASPANADQEQELRKKQALERKAKVLAQFQQQQKSFLENQGVGDWYDDDLSDSEDTAPESSKVWKFPSGVCILCQEQTNDSRLYGTFAMFTQSNVLRETDVKDQDFVREAMFTPANLDRGIEEMRPFGVSGANHEQVTRLTSEGRSVTSDRQGLSRGWPRGHTKKSPISTGCGHLMHFFCFENYFRSVVRRHSQQIARHHPERTDGNEFVCPLCKALGNTFLPILWKEKELTYPGILTPDEPLDMFLDAHETRLLPQQLSLDTKITEKKQTLQPSFFNSFRGFSFGRPTNVANLVSNSAKDLSSVWKRLRETIHANSLNRPGLPAKLDCVSNIDALFSILASSVSAVEIAQRGVSNDLIGNLLDKTSPQTLSHLRILSETINSYISSSDVSMQSSERDLAMVQQRLFHQIFAKASVMMKSMPGPVDVGQESLLTQDVFDVFVQSCLVLSPNLGVQVCQLLQICYLAQAVQVIVVFLSRPGGLRSLLEHPENPWSRVPTPDLPSPMEIGTFSTFVAYVADRMCISTRLDKIDEPALLALVRAYSLTFLRKATIFLHINQGIDFPRTLDHDLPEMERLARLLMLPTLVEMFSCAALDSEKVSTREHVSAWIDRIVEVCEFRDEADEDRMDAIILRNGLTDWDRWTGNIALPHPAPLELIGLPKHFDTLMEEANRVRCPTTGKDLVDPALCLFCGAIICSQAVCCMVNDTGPANLHIEKCSFPIGLFLVIRKCTIVLLHIIPPPPPLFAPTNTVPRRRVAANAINRRLSSPTTPATATTATPTPTAATAIANTTTVPPPHHSSMSSTPSGPRTNGSWAHAPYLTKHGEVDPGLRQRHQLVLNQKRYDRLLRECWLMSNGGGNVWSTVARKLEGEINGGGWESI